MSVSRTGRPGNIGRHIIMSGMDIYSYIHIVRVKWSALTQARYVMYCVICSGGITVTFNGLYLNSSSQPRLVVFIEESSFHSNVSGSVITPFSMRGDLIHK